MITRLRAKVIAKGNDFLIADVNGIGLKVRVPAPLLDTVNSFGKEVNLFTHLRLAENGREIEAMLFGFGSPDDLALFELLLSVSGIGPKVGSPEAARKISPNHHLTKGAPPTIIFFGTTDRLLATGSEYVEKARKLGLKAELWTAEGLGQRHGQ